MQAYSIARKDLQYIADAAQFDLLRLKNAHVFLTGCTGFLGKWIIEALLWASESMELDLRLSVLTRSVAHVRAAMPHWPAHARLSLIEGDVTSWRPAEAQGISHIIHGANYCNTGKADWALCHMDIAVEGTRNMLALAARERCENLLLLSSGAVYGIRQGGARPPYVEQEDGPDAYLRESNVYAVCKYFEEMYAAAYGQQYGIRVPIARLFTFMGLHMPLHRRQALGSFLNDVRHGKDITIQGDGTAVRSYMYAADMVVCLLALLVRGEHGRPYNVGSNEPISVKALAEKVVEASGKKIGVKVLGEAAPCNAPQVYVPDTSAMEKLGTGRGSRPFEQVLYEIVSVI